MNTYFKNLVMTLLLIISFGCERSNTPTQNNSTTEGIQSIPQVKAIVGIDYVYGPMLEASLYSPKDFIIDDLYFQNINGGTSPLDEIFVLGKTSFSFKPTVNDIGKHKVQLYFSSKGVNYFQEWELEVINKTDIPLTQNEVSNTGLDIIGKDLENFKGYNINIPATNKLAGAIVKLGMADMDLANGAFNYTDPTSKEITAPKTTFVTFVVEVDKIPSSAKKTAKINLKLDPVALGLGQITDKDIFMLATDVHTGKSSSLPHSKKSVKMLATTSTDGVLESEIEVPIGDATATSFKLQLVKLYSATHVTLTLDTNSNINIHWVVDPSVSNAKIATPEALATIKTYLNTILDDFKYADTQYVDMGCNSAKDVAVFVNPSFSGEAQNKGEEARVSILLNAYCKNQIGNNTCASSKIADELTDQKATIAHEYFHAIQYNYSKIGNIGNEDPANWITESSAQYAADLINDFYSFYELWFVELYDEDFVNMGITGYSVGPDFPTVKDHKERDYMQNLFLKYIDDLTPGTEGYNVCSFITDTPYEILNILKYTIDHDKASSDKLYEPLQNWIGTGALLVDTYLDFIFDYTYQNVARFPQMDSFIGYGFKPKSSFEIKGSVTSPVYQIDNINGATVIEYSTDLDVPEGLYSVSIKSFIGTILDHVSGGEFKAEFVEITDYPGFAPEEPLAVLDHLNSEVNVSLSPNSKYALIIAQSDFTRQLNGERLSYEIDIVKTILPQIPASPFLLTYDFHSNTDNYDYTKNFVFYDLGDYIYETEFSFRDKPLYYRKTITNKLIPKAIFNETSYNSYLSSLAPFLYAGIRSNSFFGLEYDKLLDPAPELYNNLLTELEARNFGIHEHVITEVSPISPKEELNLIKPRKETLIINNPNDSELLQCNVIMGIQITSIHRSYSEILKEVGIKNLINEKLNLIKSTPLDFIWTSKSDSWGIKSYSLDIRIEGNRSGAYDLIKFTAYTPSPGLCSKYE